MAERLMRTVFDWDHFAIYLSGAMDFTEDSGREWREEWTLKLNKIGIKSKQIYNPCKKPFNGVQFDLDDEAAIIKDCRKKKDWNRLEKTMNQIMHVDLRLVDKSDIILVNFPKIRADKWEVPLKDAISACREDPFFDHLFNNIEHLIQEWKEEYESRRVPTYGTIHEIIIAHIQRKPIFIVWEDSGLNDCSGWLIKLVGHENVFSNVDDLINRLDKISKGENTFNANEWLLIEPKEN